MGYFNKTEYEIVPDGSFTVTRNCSGCGRKSRFKNTGKFRVNANKGLLDVWLIYRCEDCGHTLNLTVYERSRVSLIPEREYARFIENDGAFAKELGSKLPLFKRNRAEVDFSDLSYSYVERVGTNDESVPSGEAEICIRNPCLLKIRPEKQIAGAVGISASRVKKLLEQEKIVITEASAQTVMFRLKKDILEEA